MLMRSRVGRTVVAMLLCASVATLMASSTALAQARGSSGLPAGSGNPMSDLQGQLTTLQQQTAWLQTQIDALAALGRDVSVLKDQMKSLLALQDTVTNLMARVTTQDQMLAKLGTDVSTQGGALTKLSADVSDLKDQLKKLAAMQSQLNTLSSQLATLSKLDSQVASLTAQMEALAAQSASSSSLAVYDSRNQMLGEVLGVDDNVPWVALAAGDFTVVLQVFPQQLIGQNLWFDAANCLGNTYVAGLTLNKGASVFSLAAVSEPGGVIYAARPNSTPTQRLAQWSMRDSSGLCMNQGRFTQTVLPASPIFTLDAMFQRPYHVQ